MRPPRYIILPAISTLAAVAALALTATSARAQSGGLVLTMTPATVASGSSGAFDVILTDTDPTNSYHIAGFSFQIAVTSGSGVTFTGADTNTATTPYVFGTDQFGPFSFDTFPNTEFTASDADFTSPFYTALTPGDTFGLGRVSFTTAPGTPAGPVTVSFEDIGGGTSLSDENGNSVGFTASNGTIQVTSATVAAPEPSSVAAFAFTGLGAMGLILRARKRKAIA